MASRAWWRQAAALHGQIESARHVLGNFDELFVLTASAELTDRTPIFSERHLQIVPTKHIQHYNGRRTQSYSSISYP